jgi:inhibitor of cysteine peptidase
VKGKSDLARITKKGAVCIATALIIASISAISILPNNGKLSMHEENDFSGLPTVGSYSNLEKLIKDAYPNQEFGLMIGGVMKAAGRETMAVADSAASGGDFSSTNVQVQGVDEADTVKTDGDYIYKIYNSYTNNLSEFGIQIIKAYPGESLKLVKKLTLENMHPNSMFIKDNYLVVLGNGIKKTPNNEVGIENSKLIADRMYMPRNSTVTAVIYDIKDKLNPKLLRTVEVDGNLTAARMIDSNLYMVSNKYIYMNLLKEGETNKDILPGYNDSAAGEEYKTIDFDEIRYCPKALEPNYIIIASFNLDKMNEEVNVTSTLGSGRNIFCSLDNLYVAGYNFRQTNDYNSAVYKFNLNGGRVSFAAAGEVPGNILNQFSMDEYKGYFRVTTTSHPQNGNWTNDSINNIYVLNKEMKLVGKVEGLAKGERIYSTRFMGEKAYMVTFKNTDPLYVIDIKSPESPKVLGELKIPGFSNYLHPYDENHIIGFGMDAEVVNSNGRETAIQQGMKIAIFDVSDVSNPKQMFMEIIGDRGTHSELLYNHKALLFSKEKNLLAFPVTVAEIKKGNNANPTTPGKVISNWGEPAFIGAYVYNIDLKKGFSLSGKITHLDTNEFEARKYDWNSQISRLLYIKDNIYTISEGYLKVNRLNDLKETGSLKLNIK